MDQVKINLEEFEEAKALSPEDLDAGNDAAEYLGTEEDAELGSILDEVEEQQSQGTLPSDEIKVDDDDQDDAWEKQEQEADAAYSSVEPEMQVADIGHDFGELSLLEFSETDVNTAVRSQAEQDLDLLNDAYEGTQIEMRDLKNRLRSRTKLVETFRLAYLRDVVAIKHCLNFTLTNEERKSVLDEYTGRLPSLDLTEALALYAPPNAHVRVKPCESCGGVLDVTMNDSTHVAKLTSIIEKLQEREERLRLTIATQDAHTDTMTVKHNADSRQHAEEKRFLYSELKKTKEKSEKIDAESIRINQLSTGYRDQIRDMKVVVTNLEVKADRLLVVEREVGDLKVKVEQQAAAVESGDSIAGELQLLLSEEQSQNKAKEKVINERDNTIQELLKEVDDEQAKVKKLKGLNEYLEKNYEESQVKIVKVEGELADLKEEKAFMEEENRIAIETLENVANEAREEMNSSNKLLDDAKVKVASLQNALSAAEQLIEQKEITIQTRDKELMAMAAEMEALQEELSAMKIFLSDTVASKKTPSRAQRNRNGGGGGGETDGSYDEEEDEDMGMSIGDDDGSASMAGADTEDWVEVDAPAEPTANVQVEKLNIPVVVLEEPGKDPTYDAAAAGNLPQDISQIDPEKLDAVDLTEYKRRMLMKQSGTHAQDYHGKDYNQVDYEALKNDAAPDMLQQPSAQQSRTMSLVEGDDNSVVSADASQAQGSVASSKGASVPANVDFSHSTVAPPTVQSEPKKKHTHKREEKAAKSIALLPPTENATSGELMLRKEFMEAINTSLGSTGSKKAMNAARLTMATYGRFMSDSVKTLWQGTLMAKRAMDLQRRVETYVSHILKCTEEGTTENDIGDMLSELVPKIGSNYNFTFSEQWQAEIDMDDEFANLLDPSLDKETEMIFYKDFTALFGDSKEEYVDGVDETGKYFETMVNHFDKNMLQVNKDLSKTVKEWCEAKTIQVNFAGLVKKAKAETKKEMQLVVDDVHKELGLSNGRFDAAKTFSKSLETKLETVNKRLVALEALPEQLAITEAENKILAKNKIMAAETIEGLRVNLKAKIEEFDVAVLDIEEKKDKINDMHKAITNSAEAAVKFEQVSIFERQQKEKTQATLSSVIEKEEQRKGSMMDKYTDCVALQKTVSQQTEFLTPDMSVRTIAATGKGTIYARRPFGATLTDASVSKSQWDIEAHIHAQAGNKKIGPYATNFGIGSTTTGKAVQMTQTLAPGMKIDKHDTVRKPTDYSKDFPMSDMVDDESADGRSRRSRSVSPATVVLSQGGQVVTSMSVSIGTSAEQFPQMGQIRSPVRTSEMGTGEFIDGLTGNLMRESVPQPQPNIDDDDGVMSLGNFSRDSFTLMSEGGNKQQHVNGRVTLNKPGSAGDGIRMVGVMRLPSPGVAEYSRRLASDPIESRSRIGSPISGSRGGGRSIPAPPNQRGGNPEINPIDMLELARARLLQERSERSANSKKRSIEGHLSPLKQAGLRNIDTVSGSAADCSIGGYSSSSSVENGGNVYPAAGAFHGLASKSVDSINAAAEQFMQVKLAQNIGGFYRSKGPNINANKETLSDLKKKFFRQAKG